MTKPSTQQDSTKTIQVAGSGQHKEEKKSTKTIQVASSGQHKEDKESTKTISKEYKAIEEEFKTSPVSPEQPTNSSLSNKLDKH